MGKYKHDHCPCVADLEADVRELKRQLARRAAKDPLAASGKPVKRSGDPFAHLADQDRRYMEKKLGGKQ